MKKQNKEIKNKNTSVSVEDPQVQNQSTSLTILKQETFGSSLTSESTIQPGVSDITSPHYIPEETSGLSQIHTTPFLFNSQQSHRRVTPNLDISASSDYTDVMSSSLKTPFVGRSVPTDLGSVTAVSSDLSFNQYLSARSQLSIERQHFETFHHIVSEFEKPISAPSTDDSKLVSEEMCPMEIALTLTSSDISQSADERQMDVDLKKTKPRPIQADSLESDTEFFDCQQTFLAVTGPELRSEEMFDFGTLYHVEESKSLPAHDYLSVTPKITEKSEVDSQGSPCPASWASEEINLPLVLEPEDECVGEHDEEIAYPYRYAEEHSFAEELPPRQKGQYDEDDDSLERVSL